ncbi:hypothetical protein D3Y59_02925 [Hymenobacter oligotrophus]|uniref:Uncharacterized protein n=1 Tax=Hymenobacter oligotrophus TaxID=2319843 RepID=A0A3B7QXZ6_9BACT|nr:hypothetical protein [Hymenobacter oligotrophus]AYA36103.1 hypothetical protein D3Y59_02925 [Hymenobacter oligotrophus]
MYVHPLGNYRRVLFAVALGGYAGYSNRYGAPSTRINWATNTSYIDFDHEQGLLAGYLFSLNLDLAVGSNRSWLVGGKSAFQNDTFGNSLASLQL